jgi:putative oxidoreductase
MDVVELIGRIVFGLVFWLNGWAHLSQREARVGLGRMIGAPSPEITVPLTGVQMLVGATLVALGIWGDLGALLLAVFLPIAAFLAHRYWEETDPMMRAIQEAQFWKNISLMGAAIFAFAIFQQFGEDMSLTLGDPLF